MNDELLTPEKKEPYVSTIVDERSCIYLDAKGEVIEIERYERAFKEPLTDQEVAEVLIPDVSTKPLTSEEVDRFLHGDCDCEACKIQ